ncbi:MAG: 5'-methylthioadenosine/S-adenosylhomocysteine nucleosidase [Selenomonadaceae bacterium]|nr:5'-methylthioadenosine/S-adenosylhomocysteine nucleosidase [Selenomonadaceae bacterium]
MKKFFALLIAALLFVTTPAQAAENIANVDNADNAADLAGATAEKFYATLPKAKGDYKSRQRPIVIEGAMNTETEVLVRALKNPVAYHDLNYLFVAGTYKNYPVVIVRTEQGLTNVAASTTLAIKKFNPVAVINQGTAGGVIPSLPIGSIVIAEKSIPPSALKSEYSAAGAGVDFTKQEMRGTYAYNETTKNFQPYKEYFADKTLLNVAEKVAAAHKEFNVANGTIGSADWWMCWVDYTNLLHERYGMITEEMETVSAAQICQNAGVPFIGIRVISDNITITDEYNPYSAKIAQDFVLLVVEDYIRDVLKK